MTMVLRFILAIASVFLLFITGCSASGPLLGTIGGEDIPLREFEKMYANNNGGWEKAKASDEDERKRFLDLFVKYKLKLLEAKDKGLLQDTAVQNELQTYRSSIASSYTLGKELIEPRLKQMHQRQLEEIRASHILIKVNPDASPVDTLIAYTKADQVGKMLAHSSFDSVARQYSNDPSAQINNGDLGWFSQGRMVPEFEDAAYSLNPGGVTPAPIRTRFGYHIIKVIARQPNKGSVRASHILKRFAPNFSDTAAVRDSIEHLFRRLTANEITFAQAASLYSDDAASKMRGGDLGFYERSSLPPDIASIFFSSRVGTISPPYRAAYGYHLFTVTETKAPLSFSEAEKDLRQRYQQMYYTRDYENYLHSLIKQYNLNFDVLLRYNLSHAFDTTTTAQASGWADSIKAEWLQRTLFSYGPKTFSVRDFVNRVSSSPEFGTTVLTPVNIEEIVERLSESEISEYHTSTVSSRFPEFDALMKEYENGTLIYRIEQDEIYNKVAVSDSLLRQFYESNRSKYRWPLRVNIAEIFVRSESRADSLYARIRKGEDFGSLAATYTERPGFKEKRGEWGLLPMRTNELTATAVSMVIDSVAIPFSYESGWSIIKKLDRKPVQEKTFEEALPELTAQYRENATKMREEEWISSLRTKYNVTINADALKEAFKGTQGE